MIVYRNVTGAEGNRAPAPPVAEDGGDRPAHRRRRARLQQHPHRDHRHDRNPRRRPWPTGRSSPPIAKMIDEAADRGADLTRQLLAFARKQPLQPRETDINALIVDTAKLLRPTLGEQIEIESMLDRRRLAGPGRSLAAHHRAAQSRGQRARRHAERRQADARDRQRRARRELRHATSPTWRAGHYVMIAVSDTGSGIPAAIRDKVFEPFFTTKEVGKGTGLGLSMVYGFVKQSGGHIKIYSEEGHGTTIKLYLPRGDAAQADMADAPPAPRRRGRTRDHPGGRGRRRWCATTSSRSSQSLGYRDARGRQRRRGARAWPTQARHFDLLFTDVIMPGGMNGRQLADEVVEAPAVAQGAVHVRLYRERHRASRPARSRRAAADQALSQGGAGAHGAAGTRWRRLGGYVEPPI